MRREADYQGWSNWETWNTSLMLDNDYDTYSDSRKLFEQGMTVEQLQDFLLRKVIGPYNKERIEDAKEWNSIPKDERIDHHFEDLKEKSQQAADFVDALGFGPDVEDSDPELIDPDLVNYQEIWDHLYQEIQEGEEWEQAKQKALDSGIGWATNGGDEQDKLRDAIYRHYDAKPDEWFEEQGIKHWDDPRAYHNMNVTMTPDEFLQTNPNWNNYIDRETRMKIWSLQHEMYPNAGGPYERDQMTDWNDPRIQALIKADPEYQRIMQEGYTQRLHDYASGLMGSVTHGNEGSWQHPHRDLVNEMLANRGYTPEEIAQITQQRWRWQPNPQFNDPNAPYDVRTNPGDWINLSPAMDQAQYDKTLDQPGDFTLPEHWGKIARTVDIELRDTDDFFIDEHGELASKANFPIPGVQVVNAYVPSERQDPIGSIVYFPITDSDMLAMIPGDRQYDPVLWVEWIYVDPEYRDTSAFAQMALLVKAVADQMGLPIKAYFQNQQLERVIRRYFERAANVSDPWDELFEAGQDWSDPDANVHRRPFVIDFEDPDNPDPPIWIGEPGQYHDESPLYNGGNPYYGEIWEHTNPPVIQRSWGTDDVFDPIAKAQAERYYYQQHGQQKRASDGADYWTQSQDDWWSTQGDSLYDLQVPGEAPGMPHNMTTDSLHCPHCNGPMHGLKCPSCGFEKQAGMTNNQKREAMDWLDTVMGPDQSSIVYTHPSGHTIRHVTRRGDVERAGRLMHNCWAQAGIGRRYDNEDVSTGYRNHRYTLNDPTGFPVGAFFVDPPVDFDWTTSPMEHDRPAGQQVAHNGLGHGNAPLKPEYFDMIKNWADTSEHPTSLGYFKVASDVLPSGFVHVMPDHSPNTQWDDAQWDSDTFLDHRMINEHLKTVQQAQEYKDFLERERRATDAEWPSMGIKEAFAKVYHPRPAKPRRWQRIAGFFHLADDVEELAEKAYNRLNARPDIIKIREEYEDARRKAPAEGEYSNQDPIDPTVRSVGAFMNNIRPDVRGVPAETFKMWEWLIGQFKRGNADWFADNAHIRDILTQATKWMQWSQEHHQPMPDWKRKDFTFDDMQAWVYEMNGKSVDKDVGWQGENVIYTFPDGWYMSEVPEQDCGLEGELMGHCVGGYGYQISAGSSYIVSLRDPKGNPHVTLEMDGTAPEISQSQYPRYKANPDWEVVQIQGKQDREPIDEYKEYIKEWFNSLKEQGYNIQWGKNSVQHEDDYAEPEYLYDEQTVVPVNQLPDVLDALQKIREDGVSAFHEDYYTDNYGYQDGGYDPGYDIGGYVSVPQVIPAHEVTLGPQNDPAHLITLWKVFIQEILSGKINDKQEIEEYDQGFYFILETDRNHGRWWNHPLVNRYPDRDGPLAAWMMAAREAVETFHGRQHSVPVAPQLFDWNEVGIQQIQPQAMSLATFAVQYMQALYGGFEYTQPGYLQALPQGQLGPQNKTPDRTYNRPYDDTYMLERQPPQVQPQPVEPQVVTTKVAADNVPGMPVSDSGHWVWLDGKVGFGGAHHEIAEKLADELGYDKDDKAYVSNWLARGHCPSDRAVAVGTFKNNRPYIWNSTRDRNHIWDSVMRAREAA